MKFDPVAVGDKIAGHLAEADKAVAANREHSTAAGMILLDVQENHPKHLDAICKRIGLGLSRRKELLMIAGGRKTLDQSRADNAERQRRLQAKRKAELADARARPLLTASPSPPPEPASPSHNTPVMQPLENPKAWAPDPDASAAAKVGHRARR